MSHWRLFYHLVWATRDRHPLLSDPSTARILERSLERGCQDLDLTVHAIGTMPDHVHLACSIPPSLAIADAVKRLKGASSRHLNQTAFAKGNELFAWQSEYGVYSFTERALADVVAYVRNQEARHAAPDLWSGFEQAGSREPTNGHRALNP